MLCTWARKCSSAHGAQSRAHATSADSRSSWVVKRSLTGEKGTTAAIMLPSPGPRRAHPSSRRRRHRARDRRRGQASDARTATALPASSSAHARPGARHAAPHRGRDGADGACGRGASRRPPLVGCDERSSRAGVCRQQLGEVERHVDDGPQPARAACTCPGGLVRRRGVRSAVPSLVSRLSRAIPCRVGFDSRACDPIVARWPRRRGGASASVPGGSRLSRGRGGDGDGPVLPVEEACRRRASRSERSGRT